jgi:hypothetical protein
VPYIENTKRKEEKPGIDENRMTDKMGQKKVSST